MILQLFWLDEAHIDLKPETKSTGRVNILLYVAHKILASCGAAERFLYAIRVMPSVGKMCWFLVSAIRSEVEEWRGYLCCKAIMVGYVATTL